MKINMGETSTQRGIVWVLTGVVSIVMSLFGIDPTPVLSIGSAVSGGMAVLKPDVPKSLNEVSK